ncbi:MAG: helix-turn-helix domain-containing protein, partial [Oscillospiraceae bacterium]|nr:helix-turn-helix domain-containing protein [Oscillospiraceae bacterium]
MNISANLRRLRQKLDMTQETLAAAVCVSPQAVSKWERGEGLPDITLVPSIA